ELLARPAPAFLFRLPSPLAGSRVELDVLVVREPGAVRDLAGPPERRGQVGKVRQPAVAVGALEHLAEGDDLLVQGAARGLGHNTGVRVFDDTPFGVALRFTGRGIDQRRERVWILA